MPTVKVGPAWQESTYGGQSAPMVWSNYRNISGAPSFRLTDVTESNGTQWYRVDMRFDLLDSSGAQHGTGSVTKWWGADATTGLGYIGSTKNLRFRTSMHIWLNGSGQPAYAGTWTGYLSW